MKKPNQKSIIVTLITLITVMSSSMLIASAQCSIDGVSTNTGNGNANNIVCDATNNPAGANVDARAGSDTITIENGAVTGRVRGQGGADTIVNNGLVDNNLNGNGGQDEITVNGTVSNSVSGGPAADTIIINGTIGNNVNGNNGNDTIIIQGNANITNNINGGGGNNDTLRFEMVFCEIEGTTFTDLNADITNSNPATGTVTINGSLYTWRNFENLQSNITEDLPDNCFVAPVHVVVEPFYGFTDGRLNGLQCPIWLSEGNMTIYSAEGTDEVVLSQNLLSNQLSANTLLINNLSNTVRVYQLTSGEIQVECDVWDTFLNNWKTDIYVFTDLLDQSPEVIR